MNIVRYKWNLHKTYRRVKVLWDEYTQLEGSGEEVAAASEKLNTFLDSVLQAHKEFIQSKNPNQSTADAESIDSILGDSSDILTKLISTVTREVEKLQLNMHPVFAPGLLHKILYFVSIILKSAKYKAVVRGNVEYLEHISNLLKDMEDPESKTLLVQILRSLGEELTTWIDIGRLNGYLVLLGILEHPETNADVKREILLTLQDLLSRTNEVQSDSQDLTSPWRKKITSAVGEMRTAVFNWRGVFKAKSDGTPENELSQSDEKQNSPTDVDSLEIPSRKHILAAYATLKSEIELREHWEPSNESEDVKVQLCEQGALTALLNLLKEEQYLHKKILLIELISKLISKNIFAQKQLKEIDGYSHFYSLFDSLSSPHYNSSHSISSIEKCFHLFCVMAIDGNNNKRVGNLDALLIFFKILSRESIQVETRLQALKCIQDIITTNTDNIIFVEQIGGVNYLFDILRNTGELMYPPDYDEDALQVVFAMNDIIDYVAAYFLNYSDDIQRTYLNLLENESEKISNTVKFVSLHSTVKLTSNALFNGHAPPNFLNSFIHLLKEYIAELESTEMSVDNADNMFTLDDLEEFTTSTTHVTMMAEPWIDQILLILEVIGITLSNTPPSLQEFDASLLISLVSPLLPMEVVELALWLLQHIILRTNDHSNLHLVIKLLENTSLSPTLKERVCYAIVELMYSCEKTSAIKQQFQELGGLLLLLDLLKIEREPNLCYAVLHAFGEAITDCEGNKAYISENIGFSELAKLIQSSVVQLDTTLFEIFFEIATKGTVRYSLEHTALQSPVTHSSKVSSIIMDILAPQPLNTKAIPAFRTLRSNLTSIETVTASFSPEKYSSGTNGQPNFLRDSQENEMSNNSSESSLIILDDSTSKDSANSTTWYKNIRLRKSCSYSPDDVPLDWTDQTEQTNSNGETESESIIALPQLVGLKVRNTDAIFMLIDLLPRSDVNTQREVLELLMGLLESNPENKSMIFNTEKFPEILAMARNAPKEVSHEYFSLVSLLGCYSIRKEHAIQLLEFAKECNDSNMQMEISLVLHRLAQRRDPLNYFYLTGEKSCIQIGLVDRFPSSKSGYTFCCWLKINLFRSDEVGLYSWLDQTGNTIFELYFKKFTYENNTERYCLAVQTQNLPMPSEHFSFDAYAFKELSKWHHIAFTHEKQTVALYVDGVLIQKSSSLNYPRTVSKDKALTGKIGYRIDDRLQESFFCGSFATFRFVEGALPESVIRNIYAFGSSADVSILDAGAEKEEFLAINPAVIPQIPTEGLDGTAHILHNSSDTEELICKSPDKFPRQSRMRPHHHKLMGDVSVHQTNSFKSYTLEINTFSYCLNVMTKGPNEQVAALSIICLLLQKHKEHREAFRKMNGYSILYHLLSQFTISMEIFDILLDILCDGAISHRQYTFVDTDCAILIFDLLLHTKDIHKRILSHIDHMLLRNPENIRFLIKSVGFYPIFQLQGTLSNTGGAPLFHIAARMFRGPLTFKQADEIFSYILSDNSHSDAAERKTKILHHLQVAAISSSLLSEYLKDFEVIFALLRSPIEGIRLIAINFFGISLDACKNKTNNFLRYYGYHRMASILKEFPVTIATCAQLLDFSIGTFQFRGESMKSKKSLSPRNSWNASLGARRMNLRSENRSIIYPETLLVLLGILKDSNNPVAKIQALTHVEQLLASSENKEQLWKCSWLEWCASFMTNQPHDPDTRSLLDTIIQQMMLYELSLQKSTRFLQLKEMIDNEPFQIHILEVLIEYFDENPCLPADDASEIIRSLRLLYKDIEYITGAGVVCMKTLSHINLLAYQNTAEIRAVMKTHGLFDVRDDLIFHLLRGISDQDTIHFIQTFSFHSIANQPKFRENKGIVYLLQWFNGTLPTRSTASHDLLIFIYRILSGVFGPIEENRKIITKILGDSRVCENFFNPILLLGRTSEHEDENIDRTIIEENFLSWYFAEEREGIRKDIQSRIHKILTPIEAKFASHAEKATQRKLKKQKEVAEKKEKFHLNLEKYMEELQEKETSVLEKSKLTFEKSLAETESKRNERMQCGRLAFRKLAIPE